MKRKVFVLGLLLLGWLLAACSSNNSTKVKLLFIGSPKDFAKVDPLESVESEFEPWSSQNLLPFFNPKAPKKVSFTYGNGLEAEGEYSGESKVCIPNTFVANKYTGGPNAPYLYFTVNDETGVIYEFVNRITGNERGESVSGDSVERSAEEIAEQFIDTTDYTIKYLKTKGGHTFTYYKEILGSDTRNGIEISFNNSGRLMRFTNYATKEFEDWDKNWTQKEKEEFVRACSNFDIYWSAVTRLAELFGCSPLKMDVSGKEGWIVIVGENKPAIYCKYDVLFRPSDKTEERYSGVYDFLFVYE